MLVAAALIYDYAEGCRCNTRGVCALQSSSGLSVLFVPAPLKHHQDISCITPFYVITVSDYYVCAWWD